MQQVDARPCAIASCEGEGPAQLIAKVVGAKLEYAVCKVDMLRCFKRRQLPKFTICSADLQPYLLSMS